MTPEPRYEAVLRSGDCAAGDDDEPAFAAVRVGDADLLVTPAARRRGGRLRRRVPAPVHPAVVADRPEPPPAAYDPDLERSPTRAG